MRVLVTGNQGYIGTYATSHLVSQGFTVTGIDSGFFKECNLAELSTEVLTKSIDIRDVELKDFEGIDAVVQLAALSNDPVGELDKDLTFEINYRATVRVAELSKAAGVSRFVLVSTQSIYGISNSEEELDEDESAKNPQTAYALSKWKAEQEILAMEDGQFTPVALRPSTVFGWSERLRSDIVFNNLLLTGLANGRIDVHSDGTPWRPVVHIHDISIAIQKCLVAPKDIISGRAFNVGVLNGNYTVRELAEAAQICLKGLPINYGTENIVDPRSYRVSFKRAKKELDYEAKVDLQTGGTGILGEVSRLKLQTEDLVGRKTNRLQQINYLLEMGLIDDTLRFR